MFPLSVLKINSVLPQPEGTTMAYRPYNGPTEPISGRYNVIHSLGFGKMYPTKLENMDIQIDISSQFGFKWLI